MKTVSNHILLAFIPKHTPKKNGRETTPRDKQTQFKYLTSSYIFITVRVQSGSQRE